MVQEAQGVSRPVDTPAELERYIADQHYEYSHYVAAVDIYAGSALAFPKGYPVPKSTVDAQNWEKMGLVTPTEKPADVKPVLPAPKVEGK